MKLWYCLSLGAIALLLGGCDFSCRDAAPAIASKIEPLHGRNGMVVAGHPQAAEIGLEVLESGGNAIDAAVATAFALGVAEPYGSGMGGKCAIVYFQAKTGKTWFVEGLDAAGSQLDVEAFLAAGSQARAEGALGVGVPGLVATMDLAHAKWGQLPWAGLLKPSIDLAMEGFNIVPGMGVFFERRIERIQSHPECARLYMPGGAVPREGTRLSNPDLARAMERVAENGRDGFYRGETARAIVEELQAGGSNLRLEDFNNYKARLSEPMRMGWEGYELVVGGPPTTGGATALLSMKVLEGHAWPDADRFRTADNLDHWGRVLRHVYPLIQANIADTEDVQALWRNISAPPVIEGLHRRAIQSVWRDSAKAAAHAADIALPTGSDGWTTHFVVVDKDGNVASVTQSLSHHFGSGVIAPGTGVILNNSLNNFSLSDPDGVNYAAPGKRARSTIAPAIVLKTGRPVLAIGLPGGQRIPTTLLAILIDYLHFGNGLGDAISAPRFHLLRSNSTEPDSTVFQMEQGIPGQVVQELGSKGWQVDMEPDPEFFGGVTAIEISDAAELTGWADTRRTNHAAGY